MMQRTLLTLLFLGMVCSASAQPQTAVKDARPDIFIPVTLDKIGQGGYLGERRQISVTKRLMELNLDVILEPYRKRPWCAGLGR
jgi:hypothetical protein